MLTSKAWASGSIGRAWAARLVLVTLGVALAARTLAAPGAAHAQDQHDSASARALFQEGVELSKVPSWAEAADRFQRSLELRRSPVVAWNLATAWIELGRLVEASELLREIVRDEKAKKPLKRDAEKVLAEIEPKIGKLRVSLAPGSSAPSEVRVNERTLPEAAIGVSMPADPGATRVVALRDGKVVFERMLLVAAGAEQTVEIALSDPAPAPVASKPVAVVPSPRETARTAPEPPPPSEPFTDDSYEEPEESDSLFESPIFWVTAGVLVAGGVVTGVLLATSGGDEKEEPVEGTLEPGRLPVPQ